MFSTREALFAIMRKGGATVRRMAVEGGGGRTVPKTLVGATEVPLWTSQWKRDVLPALSLPPEFSEDLCGTITDVAPNYNVNSVPEKVVGTLDLPSFGGWIGDKYRLLELSAKVGAHSKAHPSHFMTRLELVVDQARSEHRDEKVVQAFAGLIVQEIFYDQPHFFVSPQPWVKNRITFSIHNTTIESIVDIAVWDMTRILPSLVLIGNVEVKDPRNDWSYPQFMGQLITQGVNNYAAKLVDPDGFYSSFGIVVQGWNMWICRVRFPASYFPALFSGESPPEAPIVRFWGERAGVSLLSLKQRQEAFNIIKARGLEFDTYPFPSSGPSSE